MSDRLAHTDLPAPTLARLRLLTRADLALLFGVTADWTYRNLGRLQADHGFPPPLDGFGQARWDPRAVAAWLDRQMPAELRDAAADAAPECEIHGPAPEIHADADLAALIRRADAIAGECAADPGDDDA